MTIEKYAPLARQDDLDFFEIREAVQLELDTIKDESEDLKTIIATCKQAIITPDTTCILSQYFYNPMHYFKRNCSDRTEAEAKAYIIQHLTKYFTECLPDTENTTKIEQLKKEYDWDQEKLLKLLENSKNHAVVPYTRRTTSDDISFLEPWLRDFQLSLRIEIRDTLRSTGGSLFYRITLENIITDILANPLRSGSNNNVGSIVEIDSNDTTRAVVASTSQARYRPDPLYFSPDRIRELTAVFAQRYPNTTINNAYMGSTRSAYQPAYQHFP